MHDKQLNPLKTGMLFVAPGQIMDPGIMKLPHHPDHLSQLKADVGLDCARSGTGCGIAAQLVISPVAGANR